MHLFTSDPTPASVPSRRLRRGAVLALAAGGLLLGACGGDDDEEGTADTEESAPEGEDAAPTGEPIDTITIAGFDFEPDPATVTAGAEITVPNEDEATHTLTGEGFDTGEIEGGGEGTFTAPSEPGEYDIRCTIHPSMSAAITVV